MAGATSTPLKNLPLFFKEKTAICVLFFGIVLSSCGLPDSRNELFTDDDDDGIRASSLIDSLVHIRHPDPPAFLDSVVHARPDPGILDLYRKYEGLRHYFFNHRHAPETALLYADSTLQVFGDRYREPSFISHYLYAVLAKGRILLDLKLYGAAFQSFQRGWEMTNGLEDPCLTTEFMSVLADVAYIQGNYRDAMNYRRRAYRTFFSCERLDDFTMLFRHYEYYHLMDSIYDKLGIPDSSLHYSNLALNFIDQQKKRFPAGSREYRFFEGAEGVTIGNQGRTYLKLGIAPQAEQLFKESIDMNLQPGYDNYHAQLIRLRLSDYYIDTDRLDEAEELLIQVREYLDTNPDGLAELRWRRAQWNWYDKNGETALAYAAFQHYAGLKETLHEQEKELAALDLASQIRDVEQQLEIARLQTDGELKNVYFVLILVFWLMVIGTLFLTWHYWRRSKQNILAMADLSKTAFYKKLQLEKSNRAIKKIMNIVAHDLRNPLSGIRGISSIMLEEDGLTTEQRKWMQLMHDSSNHSMELINEMMNMNHVDYFENGENKPLKREPVEMRSYLEKCMDVLKFMAQEKNQSLYLHGEETVTAYINRDEMFRVINNIVGNAIKFSPEGAAIYLKAGVGQLSGVSKSSPQGTDDDLPRPIRISVKDEGIGIPDDLKEKVFDMFTEAKRPGTNNERSFGLGLSISKRIVEAHGGTIWLESEEGHGTTFFIELPILPGHKRF